MRDIDSSDALYEHVFAFVSQYCTQPSKESDMYRSRFNGTPNGGGT